MASAELRVLILHGPDNAPKHELLAWLRGPSVRVDARTVGEMTASTLCTVDDRVTDAMQWAQKAIALVAPDPRSPSGAPNVIDEIGRWRTGFGPENLAIIRSKSCDDMWSNLAGVVRVDYTDRVSECFEKLRQFLGLVSPGEQGNSTLHPFPLVKILEAWIDKDAPNRHPVFLVAGGVDKYGEERLALGLKEYQSTAPVTGIVRVAIALHQVGASLNDAVCDYHERLESPGAHGLDLILVGGPDTNKVVRQLSAQGTTKLPVWFDPPQGSDNLIVSDRTAAWSNGSIGAVVAIANPAPGYRFVVICAGNGARGTNSALTALARYISSPTGLPQLTSESSLVVDGRRSDRTSVLWKA